MSLNADTARTFLDAWAASDDAVVRNLLHEEVTFESPLTVLRGRDDVGDALLEFSQAVSFVEIIAIADDEGGALAMYDMHTGPFGIIRAAERYEIRNGQITADRLVFDTARLTVTPESNPEQQASDLTVGRVAARAHVEVTI